MPATYVPDFTLARDRVRTEVADVGPSFRFSDEVIAYRLAQAGFVGDFDTPTDFQPAAEYAAAIALLESEPKASATSEQTIRTQSITRVIKGGSLVDTASLLRNLRRKLAGLTGVGADEVCVVLPPIDECGRCAEWAGY